MYIISELFVGRSTYGDTQQFIKTMLDSGAKLIWTNNKYVSLIGTPKPSGKSLFRTIAAQTHNTKSKYRSA